MPDMMATIRISGSIKIWQKSGDSATIITKYVSALGALRSTHGSTVPSS